MSTLCVLDFIDMGNIEIYCKFLSFRPALIKVNLEDYIIVYSEDVLSNVRIEMNLKLQISLYIWKLRQKYAHLV